MAAAFALSVPAAARASQESGYTVAKLRVEAAKGEAKASASKGGAKGAAKGGSRVVAVVGAMPTLARGRRVRVEGEWVMDKRFGAQLKARSPLQPLLKPARATHPSLKRSRAPPLSMQVSWFEEIAPESAAGILAYLSHGCVWIRGDLSTTLAAHPVDPAA